MANGPSRSEIAEHATSDAFETETDPVFTCDTCGEEFEPWPDSYCGRTFIEKDNCQKCLEPIEPDPMGGWNEDIGRDDR
jgi:hypothetical protein